MPSLGPDLFNREGGRGRKNSLSPEPRVLLDGSMVVGFMIEESRVTRSEIDVSIIIGTEANNFVITRQWPKIP